MRRRLHLVPFTITIPKAERDEKLPAKLLEEGPGILWWMINGFAEWCATGLQPPKAVTDATDDYLGSEDVVSRWMEDCLFRERGVFTRTTDLWSNYQAWCTSNGEYVGKQKDFVQALSDRGLERAREPGKGNKGFKDVKV